MQYLNISFKDENTGNLITSGDIYLELIGSYLSYNYSTSTGLLDIIALDDNSLYTFRYRSSGYTERYYEITLTNNLS